MSYPPPPAGDQNNPYGQQSPQGQPGYGYPQQAPQGVPPQQGYGYPQQQAYPQQQYGGGYPAAPQTMPGGVKAAQIIMFVMSGLQVLAGIGAIIGGAVIGNELSDASSEYGTTTDTSSLAAIGTGVFIVIGILALAFAVWGILTAAKFSSGRGGVRISAIIYGSVTILGSLINLFALFNPLALVSLAVGVLVIVFVVKSDGAAWFSRPRA
ncbi:hypothetical protein [Streptomyces sclerotialus]|uniref:hypothetical protein n=1 Tax=Streptomyces sclerotialus TaxID=1957 RepID=UPI0004C5ECE2